MIDQAGVGDETDVLQSIRDIAERVRLLRQSLSLTLFRLGEAVAAIQRPGEHRTTPPIDDYGWAAIALLEQELLYGCQPGIDVVGGGGERRDAEPPKYV